MIMNNHQSHSPAHTGSNDRMETVARDCKVMCCGRFKCMFAPLLASALAHDARHVRKHAEDHVELHATARVKVGRRLPAPVPAVAPVNAAAARLRRAVEKARVVVSSTSLACLLRTCGCASEIKKATYTRLLFYCGWLACGCSVTMLLASPYAA